MARCPLCEQPLQANAPAPFCSARCKLVDLNNWLSDRYVISDPPPFGDEGEGLSPELLEALREATDE